MERALHAFKLYNVADERPGVPYVVALGIIFWLKGFQRRFP